MDFTALVTGRESVRSYDPTRPLDRKILTRILEAGRLAPSAANKQPWRFLVVSSPRALAQVRACYPKPWFHDAPHVLAVVGRMSEAWSRQDGWSSIETDLAIAMDHLVLAAENESVGACWIAAFDLAGLRSALGLSSEERVYAITPLGYPKPGYAKKAQKQRKEFDEVVKFL
jgi:nitroreductase